LSYAQAMIRGTSYPQPLRRLWAQIIDEDRCTDVDGLGRRCQLIRDHPGQHLLQRAGQRFAWQIGADPHIRPAWAPSFQREET
jgi:hypothetical protein